MKKLLIIFGFFLLLYSCSSDDVMDEDEGKGEEPTTRVSLGLHSSKLTANIFDLVQFSIFPKGEGGFTFYDLTESYDSLACVIPKLSGSFKALSTSTTGFYATTSWAQTFYESGEYMTILEGYKDNVKFQIDTVVVTIENKKDILNFNWKDITENANGRAGYPNYFGEYDIVTETAYNDGNPSLLIYFYPYPLNYNDKHYQDFFTQKQETIARNYISALYGESKLSEKEGEETLEQYYKSKFKGYDSKWIPKNVWETNTSRIVLLEDSDEELESVDYFAYCEPIN